VSRIFFASFITPANCYVAPYCSKINRGASKLKTLKTGTVVKAAIPPASASGNSTSSGSGSGTDELTDQDGQLWFGEIEVGNPPVKYTGSPLLFLLK
jgi:hypothetical protein